MFPFSRIPLINNWNKLRIGIYQGTVPVPIADRDPHIFSFIHRWLCGYPAHLPPNEWEIVCLLADCTHYGVYQLHEELVEQLKDQDSNLGRKATLILSDYHPRLQQTASLTDSWDQILNVLLEDILPSALKMVTELAQVMEESATDYVKALAPFVKIVVLDKELFTNILKRLIKNYALSFPAELLDLIKTLLENQRKSKNPKTRDIFVSPPSEGAEEEAPPQQQEYDIENPPVKKRSIPPPSPIKWPTPKPTPPPQDAFSMPMFVDFIAQAAAEAEKQHHDPEPVIAALRTQDNASLDNPEPDLLADEYSDE